MCLVGSCRHVSSSKAFLFSLYNVNGYAPVKLKVLSSGYSAAVWPCAIDGPTFGYNDLFISSNAASSSKSRTTCANIYALPPGYSKSARCTFFAGSIQFTPTDVEVLFETTT